MDTSKDTFFVFVWLRGHSKENSKAAYFARHSNLLFLPFRETRERFVQRNNVCASFHLPVATDYYAVR